MVVLRGQAAKVVGRLARTALRTDPTVSSLNPEVRDAIVSWVDAVERAGSAWGAEAEGRNLAMRPSAGSVPSAPDDECIDVDELAAMLNLEKRQATNIASALVGPAGRGRAYRVPRHVALAEKERREEAHRGR